MTGVVVRPQTAADDEACADLWTQVASDMRARAGLPSAPVTAEAIATQAARMRHVRTTDPDGCFVADAGGEVVGVAHALMRDGLWICSLFGVAVEWQSRGVGTLLLDRVLAYGTPERGLIAASPDPRARHRYERAGFRAIPCVNAVGSVATLPPTPLVRGGSMSDLVWTPDVDRAVRGASRAPDVRAFLERGMALSIVPGRGYVVVDRRPVMLAATDADAARQLLVAGLAAAAGATVEVGWIMQRQDWARELLVGLGFDTIPAGPVMVRGDVGPLVAWLPHGGFC